MCKISGMKPRENLDDAAIWLKRAQALRWRVNIGWWWSGFAVPLVVGCLVSALVIYIVRARGLSLPGNFAVAALIWVALCGYYAFRKNRSHFINLPSALSRMDIAHRFHHRLVSAYSGVGAWPKTEDAHKMPVSWRWPVIAKPIGLALLLLVMAFRLPVVMPEPPGHEIRHEPVEWQAVEFVTESLRQQELVQEEALNRIEEQVASLRRKPADEWYRQGTMEASSHLRDQLQRDGNRLQRALEKTANLLEAAQAQKMKSANTMTETQQAQWKELLQQLGLEAMPLNDELLRALQQLDLSQLRQLSVDELQALEERLMEQSNALKQCMAEAGMAYTSPGSGGVNRGPGTMPLTLADDESRTDEAVPQAISNPNLERAALGQMIGLAEGRHDVDTDAYAGAVEAGLTASPGGEGEVVWRQSLLPGEQKVLKNYFK